MELADEDARTTYPVERDYVRAHWLLGAANRVANAHDKAERHLHEALDRQFLVAHPLFRGVTSLLSP